MVIWLTFTHHRSFSRGTRAGAQIRNWREELNWSSQENTAFLWLFPRLAQSLFFFFFNTTEDFVPGMYQPLKSGLFYFHLNLKKKKKSPYSCPEASFIEAFPPVRIFPGVLSLCHIGKKKKKERKRKKRKKSKPNN
jgi:hypothetical protein